MSVILNAIGLVSGVLGIIGFVQDQMPETPTVEEGEFDFCAEYWCSSYRVQVGLDGYEGLEGAGGILDYLWAYNNAGERLGSAQVTNSELESGGYQDMTIQQIANQQATSLEIYSTSHAACIATVTVTMHDDKHFGWTGDWGKICGLPWYYSGVVMEDGSSPMCVWVEAHDEDPLTPAEVLGITWADFVAGDEPPSDEEAQEMCGTSFRAWDRAYTGAQILEPNKVHWDRKRANLSRRSDDRLVVSSNPGQNATALCEESNSFGPDFVSLSEGVYCNMETGETLPLCGSGVVDDCFDIDTASTIGQLGVQKRSMIPRNPTKIIRW